jgi:hypothetical protein
VTLADAGSRIRLSVTGTNAAGSTTAFSSWTSVVPTPNVTTTGGGDEVDPLPTPPSAPDMIAGAPLLLTATRIVRWRATDGGSHTYELQVRDPRRSTPAGPSTLVGNLTNSMYNLRVELGGARCWRVRIADGDSASGWSDEHCWTRPMDDRALTRSRHWKLARIRGAMLGTVASTSRPGSTLAWRTRARGTRIAIVGYACNRCGIVDVTWNGARVGRVSFRSRSTRPQRVIRYVQTRGSAIGRPGVRVHTSGRAVWIDGIALLP